MSLAIGSRFGGYEIVAPLGEGGMGEVYRARDARLERDVALKVLPASALTDEPARARLLREARLAASLNHAHICTIYEVGETGGQLYIAMELVNGRQLNDLIPSDGLPLEIVVRYGLQVAGAVGHAHDHGIVHRDLKGANVLVTLDGRAKVLDFGIATRHQQELEEATRSRVTLEGPGVVAGTLPYLAPEVLRGATADPRSDVWALGVVLYEMACGHRPFHRQTSVELTSAILRDAPPPLPSHIGGGLAAIVRKCLAKDPTQRYRNAGEVCVALEAVGSGAESLVSGARRRYTSGWPWSRSAAAGAVIALVLLVLTLWLSSQWWPKWPRPTPSTMKYSSVAVLPFKNLSGDSSQDYLADGLTDAMIGDLTHVRGLRVISLTSALQYKGGTKSLSQIAKELKVETVVEGSMVRSGDRVLIRAQLVEAASERSLWSDSFERDLSDILATQREISRIIAGRISASLTPEEQSHLASLPRVNPAAYLAYQRGRFYWNQRTESALKLGVEQFTLALEADPTYALAYSGLADCYTALGYGSYLAPKDAFPKARAAAEKALEFDPSLAEPHASLGYVRLYYDWKFADARAEFQRSLELNPSYATAHHWYSVYLTAMERPKEARKELELAQELDPLSVAISTDMGFEQYYSTDYEAATKQLKSVVEMTPKFPLAHLWLGRIYQQRKMYAEAIGEYEQTSGLREWVPTIAAIGNVYALQGKTDDARKVLAHLDQISRERYVTSYGVALVYAGLGDKEQAFAKLERAFEERSHWLVWLSLDPRWEGLRADPRFGELKRRIGLDTVLQDTPHRQGGFSLGTSDPRQTAGDCRMGLARRSPGAGFYFCAG